MANSVEDGLNRVKKKIDLVVVDSRLSEIGGAEVVADLHRNDPEIAVIMTAIGPMITISTIIIATICLSLLAAT